MNNYVDPCADKDIKHRDTIIVNYTIKAKLIVEFCLNIIASSLGEYETMPKNFKKV